MKQAIAVFNANNKHGFLFLTLNFVDLGITAFLLSIGAQEMNPIYASTGNLYSLAATKIALTSLILIGLVAGNRMHLLKWLNIGLGLIVIWNIIAVATWIA
jgi:hypothetical protein